MYSDAAFTIFDWFQLRYILLNDRTQQLGIFHAEEEEISQAGSLQLRFRHTRRERHLNPNYADSITDNSCDLYKKHETQKMAYGFRHMFDNLPLNKAKKIHSAMETAFSHTTFYLCMKGAKPTPPDKQATVKRIFRKYGITDEPQYDKIVEEYNFL